LSSQAQDFDEWKVSEFLKNLKDAVSNGLLFVIPREKNNEFLAQCGMTPEEREKVIAGLTAEDYRSGPEEDRDNPGEKDIWKFSKRYLGKEIYIKLKVVLAGDKYYAKCLSFHD
jgi:hypothetical protein